MNGKQSKRLRNVMLAGDRESKRKFKRLNRFQKEQLGELVRSHTKLGPIDYLSRFDEN